jgi:hypothetical protein
MTATKQHIQQAEEAQKRKKRVVNGSINSIKGHGKVIPCLFMEVYDYLKYKIWNPTIN